MTCAADWRLVLVAGGAAGLLVAPFWDPGSEWLKPVLATGLVAICLVERGRVTWPGMALIGLAAALAGLMAGNARLDEIDSRALDARPGTVTLAGFAIEPASESRGTTRFAFDSDQGRVLVESTSSTGEVVAPGTGLKVTGDLGPAPEWQRADLRRRGIRVVLRAGRIDPNGGRRTGLTGMIDSLRGRAFTALEQSVPQREAALSRGFVLGDDSDIDRRTTEDFQRSGLAHLLAVSGQNIVLLALLAIPFLAMTGMPPRVRLLAIGGLILLYIPLAGGGPSIQRAGVMGIAGLVAAAATRGSSRVYTLALAALITLALDPRTSADIGWQLSFAAVIGIMLLTRPFQVRIGRLIGDRGWRMALTEGMAVTLAATIATAPLIAFHFERLPVATVAANLLAMPAVAPAMWAGMTGIAVGQVNPQLAVPFNLAGSVCLAWIAQVAEWFGRPGWAVIEVGVPGLPALVVATGLLAAATWAVLRIWPAERAPGTRSKLTFGAALSVLLIVVISLSGGERRQLDGPEPGGARVEILDIGQGDAILVRPWEADPILIDGGPPGGDLSGALESAGVDRLAAVLLTHADLDHYGGLLDLFGMLPVERFLFDQSPPELLSLVRAAGVKQQRIAAGARLQVGNVALEVLWPPTDPGGLVPPVSQEGDNERSIVALLKWRKFRMLLTGDAEAEPVSVDPGPIDALKVAHHGSEDPGLRALLAQTRPRLAVISAGEGNSFGHPVPTVLNELTEARVATYRTDRDGTISIVLDASGRFQVETGQ